MSTASECLVILLHGVGSNGRDLAFLAGPLSAALPGALFAAPNAPHPFNGGRSGHQWFSVSGVNDANRAERVAGAREGFDRVITAEIERRGFLERLDRVALFGFSQGAILSLDALGRGRWPVGAVVAASGRLAIPPSPAPAFVTPLLLLHGAEDRVVPAAETPAAQKALAAVGFSVEAHVYPGLGHTLSPEGVAVAAAFLKRTLGGKRP